MWKIIRLSRNPRDIPFQLSHAANRLKSGKPTQIRCWSFDKDNTIRRLAELGVGEDHLSDLVLVPLEDVLRPKTTERSG